MINKIINTFFKSSFYMLLFFSIIYRISLDYIYKHIMTTYYSYYGFTDNSSTEYVFLSWVVFFVFYLVVLYSYKHTEKVSNLILFFLYLVSIIPFTTIICFGKFTFVYICANSVYFLLAFGFNKLLDMIHIPRVRFSNHIEIGDMLLRIIGLSSIALVIYISWKYTGFRFSFGVSSAIEWRYAAKQFKLPSVMRYMFSWTKCINSALMVFYITKRKPISASAFAIAQILAFGVNGMKFTLFIGLVTLLIACLPRFDEKKIGGMGASAIASLTVVSAMEFVLHRTWYLASFVVMRVLFIPNSISYQYFDFFTTHTPDYFRRSFLRYFGFQTPYPNLPYLITEYYTGFSDAGSNNGLISDAITNLGFCGIVVFPFMLIILIKALDWTMEGLDVRIKMSQALSFSLIIMSTFLLPLLLTDGLIVMMILFNAMKTADKKKLLISD